MKLLHEMRQKRRGGESLRRWEDEEAGRRGDGEEEGGGEAAESLSWMEGWRKHARQEVEINAGEKEGRRKKTGGGGDEIIMGRMDGMEKGREEVYKGWRGGRILTG